MAEVAAGVVAYEAAETIVEAGAIAGYGVAKATMPLKATFSQIATTAKEDSLSLARSHHTLTVVSDKAYIFGGVTSDHDLASTDVHVISLPKSADNLPDYACVPAVPNENDGEVPAPRTRHAAYARGQHVVVHGGCDASGTPLAEDNCLWLFDTQTTRWQKVTTNFGAATASADRAAPEPRFDHRIFPYGDKLLLHGGKSSSSGSSEVLKQTWLLDVGLKSWARLPDSPTPSNSSTFCAANRTLYIIAGDSPMSGSVHELTLPASPSSVIPEGLSWQTTTFPTNPLAPGPLSRTGACLLPITTGYGRQYLLYLFGSSKSPATEASTVDTPNPYRGDIWTYQVTSADPKPTTWKEMPLKPAAVKDAIRHKLGYDSGGHSWAEVEVLPPDTVVGGKTAGKALPGPRGWFASDVCEEGRAVVVWGGVNATGDREGDGWLIRLS